MSELVGASPAFARFCVRGRGRDKRTLPPAYSHRVIAVFVRFYTVLCLSLAAGGCGVSSSDGVPQFVAADQTTPPENSLVDSALPQSGGESQVDRSPLVDLGTRHSGEDWPRFLGRRGESKSAETGILTRWPPEGPPMLWQRKLGTSYGICSVSKGRLFQCERYGDLARLTCLNSETGEFIWKFEYSTAYEDMYGYNNGPRCSPVVDDNRVYIFGAEGMLHCVRVDDGSLVWKVDTHKEFGVVQNFFGVGSTPVIEGGLLIVMVGGSSSDSQRLPPGQLNRLAGNGSGVVAFDKFTGRVQYKISDELASYAGPQLATIEGRRWCFVFARGGLLAFEPATGKIDFHYPWRAPILESVNASTPVVVGNQVFISETYGPGSSLLEVRPGGFDVVWRDEPRSRDKSMQTHWNTAIYHDGYLYGSSGRHTSDAELRCIEWKSGKVMWSEPGLTRASLLYVDGHFVCLDEYGRLRLIHATREKYDPLAEVVLREQPASPSQQTLETQTLLDYPAWAAPILSHGLLYVRGKDRLVCLELIPKPTAPLTCVATRRPSFASIPGPDPIVKRLP